MVFVYLAYWSNLVLHGLFMSKFLEGNTKASGAEIQEALEEFSAPILKANKDNYGSAPVRNNH